MSTRLLLLAFAVLLFACKPPAPAEPAVDEAAQAAVKGPEDAVKGFLDAMKAGNTDVTINQIMEADTESWKADADVLRVVKAQLATLSYELGEVSAEGKVGKAEVKISSANLLAIVDSVQQAMPESTNEDRSQLADGVIKALDNAERPSNDYTVNIQLKRFAEDEDWQLIIDKTLMEAMTGGLSDSYLMRQDD